MTKVFIGGSRHITRLGPEVGRRVDRIIERRLDVLIGDANGADKAVQRYLQRRGYERVEVFCSDGAPRNNAGEWPVRVVRPAHRRKDFDYYAAKDRVLAAEADVGLMLWDGASRGTLMNTLRLVRQDKTVVVYVRPKGAFVEARTAADWDELVADMTAAAARRVREQAVREGLSPNAVVEQAPLPL